MPSGRHYTVCFSHQAKKDVEKLSPVIRKKLKEILLEVLAKDPYEGKKLLGDLAGSYSYRLTFKDRIVYQVDEKARIIFIERARTHYGE
ncbi:MAG: type II toxin-antitoxin system mRNA interferase toxin, RelE/StbE family [Candidatus Omnitrophota bacterium]